MSNPTDTNQASELYELCKEVYEKTRWNPYKGYTNWYREKVVSNKERYSNAVAPKYTSDYLLEKLPRTVKDVMHEDAYLMLYPKGKVWKADYIGMFMEAKGDTPLKALLKLTIALSEAGELK